MDELNLTPQELAARWRLEPGTLAAWRNQGVGPRYLKLGGTILYPKEEVDAFEKQNSVETDREFRVFSETATAAKAPFQDLPKYEGLHLRPADLAERWHLQESTLANWRNTGAGPRYVKFGRRVLYPVSEIEAFERDRLRAATHVPARAKTEGKKG